MFQFVNTYISNFVAIIYLQDFAVLQLNLILIMVVKQLGVNIVEFFQEKFTVGRKITQVEKLFKQPIKRAKLVGDLVEEADLLMHCDISKQLHMKGINKIS